MKEPFIDVGSLIQQTEILSDMELQAYLGSLTGPEHSSFTAQNIQDAVNRVKSIKEQRFMNMTDQITGADNNLTSAAYYLARTSDLNNMARDIDEVASKQVSVIDMNSGLATRQHEINEWSNENKLDTLFFMQILFITLTFISVLVFLQSRGTLPPTLFFIFTSIACLIALTTLIIRARYTNVIRDSRYWHKARFPSKPNPFPNVSVALNCPKV